MEGGKTIITGCRLVDFAQERTLWGDLHYLSPDILIFVGVTKRNGAADWKYHERLREEKELWIYHDAKFAEANGVVIVPIGANVMLNKQAFDHISPYEPELAEKLSRQS